MSDDVIQKYCRCEDRGYPSQDGGHRDIRQCGGTRVLVRGRFGPEGDEMRCPRCGSIVANTYETRCDTWVCARCGGIW